ncbi:hypothetical protein F2Q68_00019628 [Brassica cretica]|uniref:Transposase MuDR plant domain-containing protein n=1 Tax=Brassica cretica TaxID=69181 RepID=A0A8S9FSS2_BRACR|nr:hypothetical protein F2Q68_00019628 [Brassica cretica]
MTYLDDLLMHLHAVYGEWLLKDCRWDFVVDNVKGARIIFWGEGSKHAELLAMAQEDYNLDMSTKSVEIAYSLPAEMMLAPDTPPIHQGGNGSEFREEDDEADEADECFEDDDDDLVEDENRDGEEDDGEEDDGEEDDGEEDADISIVAEADENGEDYSVYVKVEDENEEDDDMCFEDFKKIEGGRSNGNSIYANQSFVSKDALLSELRLIAVRFRFSFGIYKSTKTLLVTTCPVSGCQWKIRASVKHGTNTFWVTKYVEKHTCSVGDRLAQRRHCTPKYVGRLFIDRVGIIDGLNPQHITDAMKNMFGMTLDYTTSYRALLYAQTLMMRQLHAVYGEWLLKDCRWDFVVDNVKGGRIFFFGEGSTHAELLAMAQEDFNLDMSTKSVEITYSLPAEMMLAPDTLPIHVETVSEFREEDDEADECFEDDDDDLVEDENHDGEEDDGKEDDGEEDAGISIVAEADENGGDYSFYGKVEDEDEEDDDMCFEDIKKIEGGRSKIYKSTKTLLVTTCPVSGCQWKVRAGVKRGTNTFWVTKYVKKYTCSVGDRLAQRRHCTPKYVGRLFIDRVGIIDGLNPH